MTVTESKPGREDKPFSNPLNIRLALTRSVTKKQGDNYDKTIATVESDLPSGVTALEGLKQLQGTLHAFFAEQSPPSQPQQEPDPAELDKLPWTAYKEGHRAGWVFTDKAPRVLTDQLEKGPVAIGQYGYKYSGPEEKPRLFVSRAPVKE